MSQMKIVQQCTPQPCRDGINPGSKGITSYPNYVEVSAHVSVLRQVLFGRPLLRLPSGVQRIAILAQAIWVIDRA